MNSINPPNDWNLEYNLVPGIQNLQLWNPESSYFVLDYFKWGDLTPKAFNY